MDRACETVYCSPKISIIKPKSEVGRVSSCYIDSQSNLVGEGRAALGGFLAINCHKYFKQNESFYGLINRCTMNEKIKLSKKFPLRSEFYMKHGL